MWIKVCLHYNKHVHVHVLANYSPYVFESGYLSKNRVHYCTSFVLLIVTASWFFYKTFEVNELIYTWLLYVYLFSLNGPLNLTLSGKENEQFVSQFLGFLYNRLIWWYGLKKTYVFNGVMYKKPFKSPSSLDKMRPINYLWVIGYAS